MATGAFNSYYNGLNDALFDWNTATQKALLVRGYTFNAAHVFLSDATSAGATVVSTVTLTSRQVVDGAVDADDWSWPAVATGAACQGFLIVQTSAVTGGADLAASAQRLIAYLDQTTQIGFPITPNGAAVAYVVDNGVNRLVRV